MKNRRNRKLAHEAWDRPAQAVVDRPYLSAQAHDIWTRGAQVILDRLVAAVVEEDGGVPHPARGAALIEKPGRGEWMQWAQVVIDRLTTCVHVYSKPPHVDVFMPEKERQDKNARALELLHRIHALTDEADTPTDSLTELEHHDERVISGLKVLLKDTLDQLPGLSLDMQKLLKSPWIENCNGRVAEELFRGPPGNEAEGIGSGHVEHGRLPAALHDLLEREQVGEGRHPREELSGPHSTRWQEDLPRRWGRHNARSLHSAGRVE